MSQSIQWLRADMHRAENDGLKSIVVSIADLKELISTVEAGQFRERLEFSGKPLGFAKAAKVRAMLSGQRRRITISLNKTEEYDTAVSYVEIPVAKPLPEPAQ